MTSRARTAPRKRRPRRTWSRRKKGIATSEERPGFAGPFYRLHKISPPTFARDMPCVVHCANAIRHRSIHALTETAALQARTATTVHEGFHGKIENLGRHYSLGS